MTLSGDDLHLPELSMIINNISFDEAEKRGNCFNSIRKYPLLTAIHFERRFKASIYNYWKTKTIGRSNWLVFPC